MWCTACSRLCLGRQAALPSGRSAFYLANTLLEAPFPIGALDHLVTVPSKGEDVCSILILVKAHDVAFDRRLAVALQSDDRPAEAVFVPAPRGVTVSGNVRRQCSPSFETRLGL